MALLSTGNAEHASSVLPLGVLSGEVLSRFKFMLDGKDFLAEEQLPWFSLNSCLALDTLRENFTQSCRELNEDGRKSHKHIYLRYGSLRVRGSVHKLTRFVPDDDSSRLRESGMKAIRDFARAHPDEKFWLEVNWDYSCLILDLDAPYIVEKLSGQLDRKMRKAYDMREYLSRADFRPFQNIQIIERCLYADPIARQWSDENRQVLAKRILEEAIAMYLACIYAGVPLSYLSHLFTYNICSTESLPDKHDCLDEKCQTYMRRLRRTVPIFSAYVFSESRGLGEMDDNVILPLHFDRRADIVGFGAFSEVFRVRIDPAHHNFQEDHDAQFALKMFRERPTVRDAFETEREAQKLFHSSFHPHILVLLMSWTQQNRHFILYPLAEQNLRHFMQSAKPPVLTASNVIWFLRGLRGLVDAVSSIHNLARPNASELMGWHHDIKPENILVFVDQPTDAPVFKLCDFGTAKFHLPSGALSHASGKLKGTVTYEPPDFWLNESVSRPADIWSLGCVFLEFFGWMFLTYNDAVLEFASRRVYGDETERLEDDRFWQKLKQGEQQNEEHLPAKLRPAVVEQFARLQRLCQDMRAFSDTLQWIRRMLEIDPRSRPRADGLYKGFTVIIEQAEVDFSIHPHLSTTTTLMPSFTTKISHKKPAPTEGPDESHVEPGENNIHHHGSIDVRPLIEGSRKLHIDEGFTIPQRTEKEPAAEHHNAKSPSWISISTTMRKWLKTPAFEEPLSLGVRTASGREIDIQSRLLEENERLRRIVIELGGNPDNYTFR